MANTFFGFDSTIDHDGNLMGSGDEDGCIEAEEVEYDALNDETFGGLDDDPSALDDWELQHEQYAEFTESSKRSDHIENSITQLVLDDSDDLSQIRHKTDWSYPSGKNGDIFNSELLSSLQKTVSASSQIASIQNAKFSGKPVVPAALPIPSHQPPVVAAAPKKICTVEELERGLRPQKPVLVIPTPHPPLQPTNLPHNHLFFQHHPQAQPPMGRLPPGLQHHPLRIPPPGMPPPGHVHHPPGMHPGVAPNLPPGFPRMMPPPGHPAYNLLYGNNIQLPMNRPYNMPPMQRNQQPMGMSIHPMARQHQQPHNLRHMNNNNNNNRMEMMRHKVIEEVRDEYEGLMMHREKQWLLNIQRLQLNTGTPYFDDYYYTVFKERKEKNKENQPNIDRNQQRFQRHNHHRNQERQENTPTPRVYTPQQFENSLGKLQCGSVTAPRKIIDMDVVTLEKDTENTPNRDTRKIKQLLLELEGLYSLVLKAEDLRNPVAISNMEKLVEQKQKQRLRELEAASTPEQKQEVLKLLQQESIIPVDNPVDHFLKIMSSFMQDDKFTSYLNIRKGKLLLLRVLPHLTAENFGGSFADLWLKMLLSLPAVGRRDAHGDNILPRFHPFFKRYIQTTKVEDILEMVSNLTEAPRQENSRSTPLSLHGRAPLYFVASNRFGVSSLITMFVRMEYILSTIAATSEKQLSDWSDFVITWAELGQGKCPIAMPLELISQQTFTKHCNRLPQLTDEKKTLLEKFYVDFN